ncbi:helix-turn-helix domain-containing protein [Janibacter sp. G368]|uniref:helix-turn-helix domain-containing protein n=1 Tax=Janibacter sp. G368 TaxID=3420441 RepID=UPI003D0197A3
MGGRRLPANARRAAQELGEHVVTWRKLQQLTTQQVAERAGISRPTLRKLESGDPSVGLDVFLMVARALGQLDRVVTAMDPYETDLGRARAHWNLPQRVRG